MKLIIVKQQGQEVTDFVDRILLSGKKKTEQITLKNNNFGSCCDAEATSLNFKAPVTLLADSMGICCSRC